MKSFRRMSRASTVALTLSVVAACTIFVVYAQSPNTIQGCYSNGNGSLRRVNSPSDCNNSETPISWNITGPQGAQGSAGPQGLAGPIGPQGPPGETFIGVTGRWQGTMIGSGEPTCGYAGSNALAIIFIQLPAGDITGGIRIGPYSASSVFGTNIDPNISFDTGGSGVYLQGTLLDANNMNGTFAGSSEGPLCGTWSAQRIPPSP